MIKVSFEISKADDRALTECVNRAWNKFYDFVMNNYETKMDLIMDLNAVHANGNPMDFDRLKNADDFNFLHDLSGICRHLDRETSKLMNCFLPRFSRKG